MSQSAGRKSNFDQKVQMNELTGECSQRNDITRFGSKEKWENFLQITLFCKKGMEQTSILQEFALKIICDHQSSRLLIIDKCYLKERGIPKIENGGPVRHNSTVLTPLNPRLGYSCKHFSISVDLFLQFC